MSNRFFVILLAIIAIFLGIFFFTKNKTSAPGSNNTSTKIQPTNHIEGKGTKKVTLIEYGDYQCPACGAYYPLLKQLVEKYKDQIYFQFRNFPLVQLHKNAFLAARAAEAADKQGKFWEMHDLLYENQQSWGGANDPNSFFENYARQLGLNVEQFKTDAASSAINDIISADIQEGQNIKADSTPTFVLNGKKLDKNPPGQEAFNKLIDDTIAAQK